MKSLCRFEKCWYFVYLVLVIYLPLYFNNDVHMKCLHIITPVKDSIDFTLETVRAILASDIKVPFTIQCTITSSTEENTKRLEESFQRIEFSSGQFIRHYNSSFSKLSAGTSTLSARGYCRRCRSAYCRGGCCSKEEHLTGIVRRAAAHVEDVPLRQL